MGKSRRLKAERRREQEFGHPPTTRTADAQPVAAQPVAAPPRAATELSAVQPETSAAAVQAARATPARAVSTGAPSLSLTALRASADRTSLLLLAVAVGSWIASHFVPNGGLAALLGITWACSGVLLGWRVPAAGALLALATAPFISGPLVQPIAEFLRAVPIWGSFARLITDRLIAGRYAPDGFAPNAVVTLGAVAGIALFPLTRITAQAAGHGSASSVFVEMFVIAGGASVFFASWIVASHLSRADIDRVIRALPIPFAAAVATALLAWLSVPIVSNFAFDGITFGRLSGLGFPTPTAMGLAVATPLVVGTLWSRSRVAAIGIGAAALLAIALTESRGPVLALIAGSLVALIVRTGTLRSINKFWLAAGGVGVFGALAAVLLSRYGSDLAEGRLPELGGDSDRVTSWLASFQVALQNPILGGGWTSVRFWSDGELGGRNVNFAHNLVLQGLADGGLPLGLAMLAVVITAIVGIWRLRDRISPAWIAAAVALLVCGIWDMPHLRTFGAAFGGLALGLVSRKDRTTKA